MPPASRFKHFALALGALAAALPLLRAQETGAPDGPKIMLPPFVVQGAAPWRYAHPPGFEVLSLWSDSKTESFANGILAARQLFDAVLPPEFQVQFSVPTAFLLVPDIGTDALPGPLMAQVLAHPAAAGATPTRVSFMTNLMLPDRDSMVVFAVLPGGSIDPTRVVYSNDRVRLALERRVPALPRWFAGGFYDLYTGMAFVRGGAETGTAGWISRQQADALAEDPEMPRQLMPLAELFADPPPDAPEEAPARAMLRQAEASLFIRWALDGQGAPRRAALWQLVTESSAGPVTESRFKALFGEDYGSVLNDLSDYLPWALTHSLRLAPSQPPADTDIRMREATSAEIGRIKGDWERLEMDRVALQFPELVPKYRERAEATFKFAYQDAKTDPGLLAVMGLFYLDCGKPAQADPYLRAAAAGHVVRPRVYYEMARRFFAELTKAQPASGQGRLSPGQAGALLGLLDQARALSPALPEVYGLYSEIAMATDAQPGPALLKVIREGAQLFPKNPPLLYNAAVMLARGGDVAAADETLRKGLGATAEPALRTKMANLQSAIASALRSQSAPAAAH
ncbi:MAG: hypothetical protein ABSA05_02875 [Opitutaceae bacterium]|jgi:hypothetical protein